MVILHKSRGPASAVDYEDCRTAKGHQASSFGQEGVSHNWGTILGVDIIRIIVYWGLYWGNLILRNYQEYWVSRRLRGLRIWLGLVVMKRVRND